MENRYQKEQRLQVEMYNQLQMQKFENENNYIV